MARFKSVAVPCDHCGASLWKQPSQLKRYRHNFCNHTCRSKHLTTLVGSASLRWRGGRLFSRHTGYVRRYVGLSHPMNTGNGYALEHRVVMAEHLGRLLTKDEIVHHINHDRTDNRIENLQLLPSHAAHAKLHRGNLPKRFCWCGQPHSAKGLCKIHYMRARWHEMNPKSA